MSIRFMNWAWEQPIYHPAQKLTLLAIADRANDDGDCWPGIASLEAKCSIPRRTLIRALAALETGGYLTIQHRAGNGSGRKTNQYRLNCTPIVDGQSATVALRGQSAKSGEAKCQIREGKVPKPGIGQSAKSGGAKCQSLAPNPSVEPSSQPSVEPSVGETRATRAEPPAATATQPAHSPPDEGTRLVLDFILPADWRKWAAGKRPDLDLTEEAEKFADYWHSQPDSKAFRKDWAATWRSWIRNAYGPRVTPAPHGHQPPPDPSIQPETAGLRTELPAWM